MNYISLQNFSEANPFACVCSNRIRIESSKEMELLRLLGQFVLRLQAQQFLKYFSLRAPMPASSAWRARFCSDWRGYVAERCVTADSVPV